ncbi:hypothetical protein Ciccas_003481 [Cichlidogyrus casuarinus]|uniref:Uncharacterized protein n=1 Tax=Cichlidogyrus casuarinus TaxID=1844966 RepID=A0ABD2QF01_9PLAT
MHTLSHDHPSRQPFTILGSQYQLEYPSTHKSMMNEAQREAEKVAKKIDERLVLSYFNFLELNTFERFTSLATEQSLQTSKTINVLKGKESKSSLPAIKSVSGTFFDIPSSRN